MLQYIQIALSCFLQSFVLCTANPVLRALILRPLILGAAIYVVSCLFLFGFRGEVWAYLGWADLVWWKFSLAWVVFVVGVFLSSAFLSLVGSNLLLSFIHTKIAEVVLGLSSNDFGSWHVERSLLGEIKNSFVVEWVKLMVLTPLACLAFLLSFIPVLGVLGVIIGSFLLGAQYLDYSLEALGFSLKQRCKMVVKNFMPMLCFGLILFFFMPFAGLVLAPFATAAGSLFILKVPNINLNR